LVMLISSGDYNAATALAQNPDLIKPADGWKDTHLHYLSAAAKLALATGDYGRSSRLLREWRKSGTAASEGTFTRFLTLVGDYRNAHSTGLRPLDRATAGRNVRYVAIDMLLSGKRCATSRPHGRSAGLALALAANDAGFGP
jgi:hypothetical protein